MVYAEDLKHDASTGFWVFIGILLIGVASTFALLAGGGISDPQFVSAFYLELTIGIIGALYILVVSLMNYLLKKRILRPIVHDPEDSPVGKFRLVASPLLLSLLCLLIFTPVFFIAGKYSNTFFSGIPFVMNAVSGFSAVWADAILPAICENLFAYVILSLLNSWNWNKNKKSNKPLYYFFNLLIIPAIISVAWVLLHMAHYGSNDIALWSVGLFAFIGLFLTQVTMSAIPFVVEHSVSNFMLSLRNHGFLGGDMITFIGWLSIPVFLILFFVAYRWDKHAKR